MPDEGNLPFLGQDILLRVILQDDAHQTPLADTLLERIDSGAEHVALSEIVVFETIYALGRAKRPLERSAIRDRFVRLLSSPGVHAQNKRLLQQALDNFVEHRIDFADAYHAALLQAGDAPFIYSFDRDFDRIDGAPRREPSE